MALTDITSGARQTSQTQLIDAINSQRRFPINDKLYELVSGEADFLNLIRKISHVKVDGPEKSFIEHRAPWLNTQKGYWYTPGSGTSNFAASHVGAAITLKCTTASNSTSAYGDPVVGDIIQVVDSDNLTKIANLLVYSVSSHLVTGYLLTEAPGFSPAVTDKVYLVGSAHAENGAFTSGGYTTPQTRWFSTQVFKDQVSFSRTLEESKDIIYGSEADRLLREALKYHMVKIDRALLHGTARKTALASAGTTNPFDAPNGEMVDASSNRIYTSASFLQVMNATTNRDVSLATRLFPVTMAGLEYGDLIDTFEQIFFYGSESKEAICGRGVVSFFNKLAMSNSDYAIKAGENSYGIKVYSLLTPHGVLNLRPSRGMSEAGYNYAMAIIDPENISIADFHSTTWEGLPKTRDGKDIEILTDCGLWVRKPETHAWLWFI